jgi:hypothetical protein
MLQHALRPQIRSQNFNISPTTNINLNDTVLASVLEEYYHYAYLFRDELEEEVRRMDFAFNKRTQILLATIVKENNRKLLMHLAPYIAMQTLWLQNRATRHFCD